MYCSNIYNKHTISNSMPLLAGCIYSLSLQEGLSPHMHPWARHRDLPLRDQG